jgi:hypothetical protein
MPEFKVEMFLLGCLGGLLPDILRIIKNREQANVLDCFKHFTYWVVLILQILLGGFAVYILSTASITKALAIGFSAPEIIGSLLAKKEEIARGPAAQEETKFKVRAWLAG